MPFRLSPLILAGFVLAGCAHSPPITSSVEHVSSDHVSVSAHGFDDTVARLQAAIDRRDLKTFAVVDHSAGAASIGSVLPAATLIVFGSPKAGTPLMQRNLLIGLDLPLKMLVYQQGEQVQVAYGDIQTIAAARDLEPSQMPLPNIAETLAAIAAEATD